MNSLGFFYMNLQLQFRSFGFNGKQVGNPTTSPLKNRDKSLNVQILTFFISIFSSIIEQTSVLT
jgi:hypothetical protein